MRDVDLSSKENIISVDGKINLLKNRFKKLNIHILDKDSCSIFIQEVSGKLNSPEIGIASTVASGVISPVTDLLKKTKDLAV